MSQTSRSATGRLTAKLLLACFSGSLFYYAACSRICIHLMNLFFPDKTIGQFFFLLALLAGATVNAQNFVLSTRYDVGNGPNNVAVADVNNDGKLDLICANQGSLGFIRTN